LICRETVEAVSWPNNGQGAMDNGQGLMQLLPVCRGCVPLLICIIVLLLTTRE